ncbi:hypothetical protein MMC25_003958 [Agyrium rufum]|nr:hypothetical protein [Agyrium rufum]
MDLYFEFGHLWRLFLQNMNRRGDGGRADGKVHRHVTEVLQQHWDEEFSHEQWKIHPSQISQEEPLSGSENSFTGVVIADVISNRLSRATRDQVYQYCHRVSDGVADRKGISLAALITLNCPREAIASLRSGIGDADWSTFLAHAICGLRLTRLNLVHSWKTQNLPMPLYGDMSKQLALVHQLLNSQDYNIKNELRRAATSRDLSRAIEIWKRLSREMELGKLSQVMQQDLFDSLLNRFVQLGNIEHLMSVWNVMVRAGCKPTSQHWQRLFQACYKARDLASCKALWNQMKSSGIEPDNDLWAIYIRVLLHCRENEFAFAALQELVRTWKYKSSLKSSSPILSTTRDRLQDQSSIPREQVSSHGLAILPFNSAISGFLINERGEMAKRAFALMTAQKLAPDVNTFSHFLRYAVQHDKTDDIGTILRALRKRKIEPDVKICTILIDGIVRNNVSGFEEQSPQEQETVLNKVFDLLENAGVEPNKYTYGTILDGFLKREHPNLAVVRSVLARMSAQGLQPSPAIYTILATHYFALNPPDLSALDALSQRIKIDRTPIDHIFYDRMIEGYASIGEVEKMLMWLRRMPDEGKTPGWKALANVLRILIRGEEWTLIENLVRDVVDERGLFSKGQRGWVGQDEFWELVRQVEEEQGIELAPRGNQDHGTRF